MILNIVNKCHVHGFHNRWYQNKGQSNPRCSFCKQEYNSRKRKQKQIIDKQAKADEIINKAGTEWIYQVANFFV